MQKVRCKMRLTGITPIYEGHTTKKFHFEAVCADGVPENERFHKYTPSGHIELTVDNPAVESLWKLGECYYFDSIACVPEVVATPSAPVSGSQVTDESEALKKSAGS